jgi:hypothetical protein
MDRDAHRVWESCNVEFTATGRRHQAAVYSVTSGLLRSSARIISVVNLRQLDMSTWRWQDRNRVEVCVNLSGNGWVLVAHSFECGSETSVSIRG